MYLCRFCMRVVKHAHFDNIVLCFILLSSVTLVMDEPRVDPTSPSAKFVFYVDYILATLFVCEMLLKMVAFGVILHDVRIRNMLLQSCL